MVDVAEDAGVSLKTVSRVINAQPNVDGALIARVNASIAKLGYRRNALAASLRSGSADTIGFLAADLSNTFYMTVAAAVTRVAARHSMHVVIASSEESAAAEREAAIDLCQRQVGGLIVVPAGDDQAYLQAEVDQGIPVVFFDRPGVGMAGDTILIDNRGGAESAVGEILADGHERVAMLFDSLAIYTMSQRRTGALDAFRAAGREPDPALIVDGVHTPADARAAMERLLDAEQPPTAVFCANNRSTIGALESLLPRSSTIAVTGFDDFDLSRALPRRIRIVDYDTDLLGALAAETLLGRIDRSLATPPETTFVPTRLVDRGGYTG